MTSQKLHGWGGLVVAPWTWLSRDSVQAPYMKSTHMYGIVLSFLLAVFLSQPLYSNKKMAKSRLHFDPLFCVPTLYYKERKCNGSKTRHGFRLIWYGGCSFLVWQYARASLEKVEKSLIPKSK